MGHTDFHDNSGEHRNLFNKLPIKQVKQIRPSRKGAYSTKKLTAKDVRSSIIQKLQSKTNSDKKQRTSNRIDQVKAFCRTKDVLKLEEPVVSFSQWAFIPIKVLMYNSPFDLDKEPMFSSIVPSNASSETWKIYREYNNYNQEFISSMSIENDLEMDVAWLQSQRNYISKLPKYDVFTLRGYTHFGDVLVNSLLREVIDWGKARKMSFEFHTSTDFFPVYFQLDAVVTYILKNKLPIYTLFDRPERNNFVKMFTRTLSKHIPRSATLDVYMEHIVRDYFKWNHSDRYIVLISLWHLMHQAIYKKTIELFQQDLSRIIDKSPPLTKDITVFRGVQNDFYLKGAKDGMYKNIGFVSTSLDIDKAQFFQRRKDGDMDSKCCIQRITLKKGTNVILMMSPSQYGDEKEILLNHGSTYKIVQPRVLKTFYNNNYEKSYDICHKDTYQVIVSEITVAS